MQRSDRLQFRVMLSVLFSNGQCLNIICTSYGWMLMNECGVKNTQNLAGHHHMCIQPVLSLQACTNKHILSCIQSKLPINVPSSYWYWYSSHQIRRCKHLYLVQMCAYHEHTVSQFCRIWAGIKALSCDEILPFFVLCETVLLFIHTIFTVPYQNIKIKIHETIILPVLCLCENC